MKSLKTYILFSIITPILLSGCKVDNTVDPNSPSVESVLKNATRTQINQLGIGLQASARNGLSSFYRVSGSLGRELYTLNSTELTYTSELLGSMNGGFSPTTLFNGYYSDYSQTRRRAELFILSAQNSAPTALTDVEKIGVRGFANTIKGYVMLNTLNMQYKNGIRLTFSDLNTPGDLLKPGPFGSYEASLTAIKKTLDDASADLLAAGPAFGFKLTTGYNGFNTPETFNKFNRALAARTAVYQKDWPAVLQALEKSFLDLNGALTTGPVFTFSTAAGDQSNPLYQNRNTTASPVVAQNNFISEAETGDLRVAQKVTQRTTPRTFNGLNGVYDVTNYPANTAPVSILRNEELVLIYAEAKIQTDVLPEAVKALNKVRTQAGLKTIEIAKPEIVNDKPKLIDELLNQRRYSLYAEGHRWIDFRRYNRLDKLPNDLPAHHVFEQLIRPFAEIQWDIKNPQ